MQENRTVMCAVFCIVFLYCIDASLTVAAAYDFLYFVERLRDNVDEAVVELIAFYRQEPDPVHRRADKKTDRFDTDAGAAAAAKRVNVVGLGRFIRLIVAAAGGKAERHPRNRDDNGAVRRFHGIADDGVDVDHPLYTFHGRLHQTLDRVFFHCLFPPFAKNRMAVVNALITLPSRTLNIHSSSISTPLRA